MKEYLSDYQCPKHEIPDGCPVKICQYPKCVPCDNRKIQEMIYYQSKKNETDKS